MKQKAFCHWTSSKVSKLCLFKILFKGLLLFYLEMDGMPEVQISPNQNIKILHFECLNLALPNPFGVPQHVRYNPYTVSFFYIFTKKYFDFCPVLFEEDQDLKHFLSNGLSLKEVFRIEGNLTSVFFLCLTFRKTFNQR